MFVHYYWRAVQPLRQVEHIEKCQRAYLPCSCDCMPKSPVELQRLPRPECMDCGRGDGDGAGDTELLLGESECSEPFDWWIIFVRLKQVYRVRGGRLSEW